MHTRIEEFRAARQELLAATEAQIAELFEPLRREISFKLHEAIQIQALLRLAYPHNTDSGMELPVGLMLSGLLEERICQLKRGYCGMQVPEICTFSNPVIYHDDLEKISGHTDCDEADVHHLLMSCGAPLFASAGLSGIDFKVLSSYFDPMFHVEASMPVF